MTILSLKSTATVMTILAMTFLSGSLPVSVALTSSSSHIKDIEGNDHHHDVVSFRDKNNNDYFFYLETHRTLKHNKSKSNKQSKSKSSKSSSSFSSSSSSSSDELINMPTYTNNELLNNNINDRQSDDNTRNADNDFVNNLTNSNKSTSKKQGNKSFRRSKNNNKNNDPTSKDSQHGSSKNNSNNIKKRNRKSRSKNKKKTKGKNSKGNQKLTKGNSSKHKKGSKTSSLSNDDNIVIQSGALSTIAPSALPNLSPSSIPSTLLSTSPTFSPSNTPSLLSFVPTLSPTAAAKGDNDNDNDDNDNDSENNDNEHAITVAPFDPNVTVCRCDETKTCIDTHIPFQSGNNLQLCFTTTVDNRPVIMSIDSLRLESIDNEDIGLNIIFHGSQVAYNGTFYDCREINECIVNVLNVYLDFDITTLKAYGNVLMSPLYLEHSAHGNEELLIVEFETQFNTTSVVKKVAYASSIKTESHSKGKLFGTKLNMAGLVVVSLVVMIIVSGTVAFRFFGNQKTNIISDDNDNHVV